MRRHTFSLLFTLLFVVVLSGVQGVAAQNATPVGGSKFAGMGYQELHIVVDDSGIHAPSDAKAGLTVVTLENQTSDDASVTFATPKPGETPDQLITEGATPVPNTDFSAVIFDAALTGGPIALPDETSEALVNLPEGDLVASGAGSQMPAVIHVTAAEGQAAQEPVADLTVEMKEYTFTGLPDHITAGDHIMKVTNSGTQPHFAAIVSVPQGVTNTDLHNFLQGEVTGTPMVGPVASAIAESPNYDIAGAEIMSPGNSIWMPLILPPGTCAMVCFVPDKESGVPHAAMGMAQVFTVS
jgi:hypothetical protein